MIVSLFGLIDSPLTMLAVLVGFMSALFICMPAHEFAHAHSAYKEGDLTAKALGRYTLAPFKHIDVKGLLLLLFFGIGFAKPVPIDKRNFRRGWKSEIRVSIAGVLTNLVIGTIACLLYCIIINFWPALFTDYGFVSLLYYYFFLYLINLNFMFAFFNLLPIYPLDGFRVVEAVSKTENGFIRFMKMYSFWIILILLISGVLDLYIDFFAGGLLDLVMRGFNALFGLIA
ncbi:MAG: site-2 protease family protein [Clostridia bacterium]|nr:site-2 protease family protein [Clostridia bacterium]